MAQTSPRRYADGTTVPVERTRAELEKLLTQHGASAFGCMRDGPKTVVIYRLGGRYIRHALRVDEAGRRSKEALAREERRRWRALLLITKAKLELIASGDSTVEREFMADTVLADGATVYEYAGPAIAQSYETGGMPPLGLLGQGGAP